MPGPHSGKVSWSLALRLPRKEVTNLSRLTPDSKKIRALAESHKETHSLLLRPAESPSELSFHSLPPGPMCLLSWLGLLGSTAIPLSGSRETPSPLPPGCPQSWLGCLNLSIPQSFVDQSSREIDLYLEEGLCYETHPIDDGLALLPAQLPADPSHLGSKTVAGPPN